MKELQWVFVPSLPRHATNSPWLNNIAFDHSISVAVFSLISAFEIKTKILLFLMIFFNLFSRKSSFSEYFVIDDHKNRGGLIIGRVLIKENTVSGVSWRILQKFVFFCTFYATIWMMQLLFWVKNSSVMHLLWGLFHLRTVVYKLQRILMTELVSELYSYCQHSSVPSFHSSFHCWLTCLT